MTPAEADLNRAHTASIFNREQVKSSRQCGCFFCLATFPPAEIYDWTDGTITAICPYCKIDSVLPGAAGFPLSPEFLGAMQGRYFGSRVKS